MIGTILNHIFGTKPKSKREVFIGKPGGSCPVCQMGTFFPTVNNPTGSIYGNWYCDECDTTWVAVLIPKEDDDSEGSNTKP